MRRKTKICNRKVTHKMFDHENQKMSLTARKKLMDSNQLFYLTITNFHDQTFF